MGNPYGHPKPQYEGLTKEEKQKAYSRLITASTKKHGARTAVNSLKSTEKTTVQSYCRKN